MEIFCSYEVKQFFFQLYYGERFDLLFVYIK